MVFESLDRRVMQRGRAIRRSVTCEEYHGVLDSSLCDLVQELVTWHLQLHHDDPQESLAALDVSNSVREDLIAITDPGTDRHVDHEPCPRRKR